MSNESQDKMDIPSEPQTAPNTAADAAAPPTLPTSDPKLPTRKDTSLREFLNKMDDYAPIVCLHGFQVLFKL